MEGWDDRDFGKSRWRPKMTWIEEVKNDIKKVGLQGYVALDKNKWRKRITVDER